MIHDDIVSQETYWEVASVPVVTQGRAVIDVPASTAWALLADYANDPLWRKGVTRMDQRPQGLVCDGAHVVEELRILGRTVVTQIELHDVQPGTSFAWRAIDGPGAHGTRAIIPLGSARCEIRTYREITLRGLDRLLHPVVSWSMARTERDDLRRAAALVAEHAASR
ncbi:MAG: hypothetical protein C0444_10835 [Microbacterium sp.]|nr:hypothetical protein [Microbacterium sp.]MBA4347181.1 hypothetical protein [Microbacterium sp.]